MFKERALNRRSTQLVSNKHLQLEEDENKIRKFSSVEDLRKKLQESSPSISSASKDKELEDNSIHSQNEKDHYASLYKRYELLIEYANLRNFQQCPQGIYLVPQPENIYKWCGVLFIHKGYYRGGVFKFELNIPITYPNLPPSVKFTTDIFHPLIDAEGNLNLEVQFSSWSPRRDHIIDVIKFIKSSFKTSTLSTLTKEQCYNVQAFDLFQNELHLFVRLAQQSCRLSQDLSKNTKDPNNELIKFSNLNSHQFEELYPQFLGSIGAKKLKESQAKAQSKTLSIGEIDNNNDEDDKVKLNSSLDDVITNIKKSIGLNKMSLFD